MVAVIYRLLYRLDGFCSRLLTPTAWTVSINRMLFHHLGGQIATPLPITTCFH